MIPTPSRRMRHLAWPLQIGRHGRTVEADVNEWVRGLVESLLFTRPGERVNRPEFGTGIRQMVFENADELGATTEAVVHGALQMWLGDLVRIDAVSASAVDSVLTVSVAYTVVGLTGQDPSTVKVTTPTAGR